MTESKYYVYSEKGILLNRIDFSKITKKYGQIVSCSQNGLNFALHNKMQDIVSVIRFTEKSTLYLKTIKVTDQIREFSKRQENPLYNDLKEKHHWVY